MADNTFDEELAHRVDAYIERLFVPPDDALDRALEASRAAGLPPINVSATQGKLLYLVARIARATRILEIGTLGGYSTIWLARALPAHGRLVSLEVDERHAAVARDNVAHAGIAELVEIRVGPAAASLRTMIDAGEAPFDLVFVDADKEGYPEYLDLSLRLVRPGAVVLADNVIRRARVLEDEPHDPQVRAIKAFNERLAAHVRLESVILPMIREALDGLSISIVT